MCIKSWLDYVQVCGVDSKIEVRGYSYKCWWFDVG